MCGVMCVCVRVSVCVRVCVCVSNYCCEKKKRSTGIPEHRPKLEVKNT